jgi:hypothetical protein
MQYLLENNQKTYLKHIWKGQTLSVLSWKFENPRCLVKEGNIFAGQGQMEDCQPGYHPVQTKSGSGFLRSKYDH